MLYLLPGLGTFPLKNEETTITACWSKRPTRVAKHYRYINRKTVFYTSHIWPLISFSNLVLLQRVSLTVHHVGRRMLQFTCDTGRIKS